MGFHISDLALPIAAGAFLSVCLLGVSTAGPDPGVEETDDATLIDRDVQEINPDDQFAVMAFPPTIPDKEWHQNAWTERNCLACHETGVQDAPMVRHESRLPEIAMQANCRSCHILIPGEEQSTSAKRPQKQSAGEDEDSGFEEYAFPPMIPNTDSHKGAWGRNDCMLCHEDGIRDAPVVKHDDRIPRLAMKVKCRTCHVQVRSNESSPWDTR